MNSNIFYPIRIPLSLLRNDLSQQSEIIYLTTQSKFPLYQLKYFQLKAITTLKFPDYLQNLNLFSLDKLYFLSKTPYNSIKSIDFYPAFSNISLNSIQVIKNLIQYKPFLYNYCYMMGEISFLFKEYKDSLAFFLQGIEQKELFCYLKLSRIYIEPELYEYFSLERSTEKSFNYLIDSILEFGLFDRCFSSFIALYLLYLYYDCFEDFRSLVQKEINSGIFKGKLLDLLMDLDFLSNKTFEKFMELKETLSQFYPILYGDLLQDYFFGGPEGLSLKVYEDALNKNTESVYLNLRVFHDYKKKGSKEILSKVFKTTILRNKTFIYSSEIFHFQLLEAPEFINNKISDYTIHQANRLLEFGDSEILLPLFRLYKHKEKSLKRGEELIEKQNLQQRLYKIALQLFETKSNDYNEGPFSYCLEKAKGCNRDFLKSFELYEGLLSKTLHNNLDPFFFTFRLASLISNETEFAKDSEQLFDLAFRKVLRVLKKGINNMTSLYDLAKIYRKKGETALQNICYQALIRIFNEKSENLQSLSDKINYHSSVLKLGSKIEAKNVDFSIIKKEIQRVLSVGLSEKDEMKAYYKILKNLSKKMVNYSRKYPFRPPKLSGFVKLQDSLKDYSKPKNRDTIDRNIPILISKCLNFKILIKETIGKYLHIFTKNDLQNMKIMPNIYNNNNEIDNDNEVIFQNNQHFYRKQSIQTFEEGVQSFLTYLERIKFYCKYCKHEIFLKLIAISMKQLKSNTSLQVKISIFYEPFRETLDQYLNRTKGKMSLKLILQISNFLKCLQQNQFFLKHITPANFVKSRNGEFSFLDPTFALIYKENSQITESELTDCKCEFLAPEAIYSLIKKQPAQMSIASSLWSFGVLILKILYRKEFNQFRLTSNKCINYDEFKEIFKQEALDKEIQRLFSLKDPKIAINSIKSLLRTNPNERVLSDPQFFKSDVLEMDFWNNLRTPKKSQQGLYFEKGISYKGNLSNNKPHGMGLLTFSNRIYEGQFLDGCVHGFGKLKIKDNIQISGEFFCNGYNFFDEASIKNILQLINENIDKELKSLFDYEIIKKFYEKSIEMRYKLGQRVGLKGFELLSEVSEKPLFLVRLKKGPLIQYEAIYSEVIKPAFIFFWNEISFGFFEMEKKVEKSKKNLLIRNVEHRLHGVKIFIKNKTVEIGQFVGYKGRLEGGMVWEYDSHYKIIKKYIKKRKEIIELTDLEKGLRYEGIFDKSFKRNIYGKENIGNSLIFEGEFYKNQANGRGLYKKSPDLNLLFEGFVKNYNPIYGRFYGFQDGGYLEALKLDDNFLKGIYYHNNKNYRGIFHSEGLWLEKELYNITGNGMNYEGLLEKGKIKGRGKYIRHDFGFELEGVFGEEEVVGVLKIINREKKKDKNFLNGFHKIIGLFKFKDDSQMEFPKIINNKFYKVYSEKKGVYFGTLNEMYQFHGYGIFIKEKSCFEGEFINGLRQGYGILKKKNSIEHKENYYKYEGNWKSGVQFGFGRVYKDEILFYEGYFFKRKGFVGSLILKENNLIKSIEGNFLIDSLTKDIRPIGFGILSMKNNDKLEISIEKIDISLEIMLESLVGIIKYHNNLLYEGFISNFEANGIGIIYKSNGIIKFFSGEFTKNCIEGYGIMNEIEYFGLYHNGIIHEFGILQNENNLVKVCQWQKGTLKKEMLECKNGLKFLKLLEKSDKIKQIFFLEE